MTGRIGLMSPLKENYLTGGRNFFTWLIFIERAADFFGSHRPSGIVWAARNKEKLKENSFGIREGVKKKGKKRPG